MLAIFKRELRACFTGITGWLFMAVVLALFGLYFFVYNMLSGYPYVSYTLSSMAFILLIAVPILTMRIISEGSRNTLPLRQVHIGGQAVESRPADPYSPCIRMEDSIRQIPCTRSALYH